MSLRTLSRVTCKVFGHGACECSPTALSAIQFCRPSSNSAKNFKATPYTKIQNIPPIVLSPSRMSSVRLASSQSNPEKEDKSFATEPTSVTDKFKKMWQAYGVLAVGTYLSVYAGTLGSLFLALDYDIFNAATFGLDPVDAIKKFCDVVETFTGNTALPGYIRENPRVGTFAIAWVMTKFTEPLRLGFTLAIVPSISRMLGRKTVKAEK